MPKADEPAAAAEADGVAEAAGAAAAGADAACAVPAAAEAATAADGARDAAGAAAVTADAGVDGDAATATTVVAATPCPAKAANSSTRSTAAPSNRDPLLRGGRSGYSSSAWRYSTGLPSLIVDIRALLWKTHRTRAGRSDDPLPARLQTAAKAGTFTSIGPPIGKPIMSIQGFFGRRRNPRAANVSAALRMDADTDDGGVSSSHGAAYLNDGDAAARRRYGHPRDFLLWPPAPGRRRLAVGYRHPP